MLNTLTTTVPALSRPRLVLLNFDETYSLSSTDNTPFQTNTTLNATIIPSQTLNRPQSAPFIRPSAFLPSSSSLPTVNPINSSPVVAQNYTVPLVAMNKSLKTFDGLDHHYIPEEYLHQIDTHMIFTMREELLDSVV